MSVTNRTSILSIRILGAMLALGFLLCSICRADVDMLPNLTDTASTPVLNENLQRLDRTLRTQQDAITAIIPIDLTASVTGILPIANGGTGGTGGGVPQGAIIMWSGTIATIPTGYELADGSCSISCPDLRNRFIVGADADVSSVAKSTVTGSALQTSDGVIPAHTHTYVTPYGAAGANPAALADSSSTDPTMTTSSYGTGTKNIATFYALAFIIKT